jgi:hypothetical protein
MDNDSSTILTATALSAFSSKINNNIGGSQARAFNLSHCRPKILLIGDSVDRQLVEGLCETKQSSSATTQDWANKVFKYSKSSSGAVLCNTSEWSIGQLHVFGSNPSGPYLNNYRNTPGDPFIDTKPRICKGIEVFSRNVGVPTLIVFQIMLWDISVLLKTRLPVQAKVQRYRDNIIARVKEIQLCKNRSSTLMLRTVPAVAWAWAENLGSLFNGVLRNVSREMGIAIQDYDTMLWGTDRNFSRHDALFRDTTHPRKELSIKFASHLLDVAGDLCTRSAAG